MSEITPGPHGDHDDDINMPSSRLDHQPAADSDPRLNEVTKQEDIAAIRRQIAPLSFELRESIRVELAIRFAHNVQLLLEKAADSFSVILATTDELAYNPDAEHLIERHQAGKNMLVDLITRGGDIGSEVLTCIAADPLDGAELVRLYDIEISPWLAEYGGFLESSVILERDLNELLIDAAAEDMQEAMEASDDSTDTDEEIDDDSTEISYSQVVGQGGPHDEYPTTEELDQDMAFEDYGDPIIDSSPDIRFLMSMSQSLMIMDPVEAAHADLNLVTLELLRTQGVGSEFSDKNILVPMELSEVLYCIQSAALIIRSEFREALTEAAHKELLEGRLYQGESGAVFRKMIGEYFRTEHPLRAEVGNEGVVTLVHDIPEVLHDIWKERLPELDKKLELMAAVLESRGHIFTRQFETFQFRFSGVVDEHDEELVPTHLYCEAQQEALSITKRNLYGKLSANTHVALPRAPVGAKQNKDPYHFTAEDATLQAIGIVRPLDSLLGHIDRLVGSIDQQGVCVAVNSQITGDQPDYIIQEPYENGGPLDIHLFTPQSRSQSSIFMYSEGLDVDQLVSWVRTISSEPSGLLMSLKKPFKVSPPHFAPAPRGIDLKLDEILIASSSIKKALADLCEHGNARITVGHDYFAHYTGADLRVDLVEHGLTGLADFAKKQFQGKAFGASADWFSGVRVNGINAFAGGLLLRLYDEDGSIAAQGLLDGRRGLGDFMLPVDSKLLQRADESIQVCFQNKEGVLSSVSDFTERLAAVGLQFDDVYLFMTAWQASKNELTSGYVSTSPVQLLQAMIRMPDMIVEEDKNHSRILVRAVRPEDHRVQP